MSYSVKNTVLKLIRLLEVKGRVDIQAGWSSLTHPTEPISGYPAKPEIQGHGTTDSPSQSQGITAHIILFEIQAQVLTTAIYETKLLIFKASTSWLLKLCPDQHKTWHTSTTLIFYVIVAMCLSALAYSQTLGWNSTTAKAAHLCWEDIHNMNCHKLTNLLCKLRHCKACFVYLWVVVFPAHFYNLLLRVPC